MQQNYKIILLLALCWNFHLLADCCLDEGCDKVLLAPFFAQTSISHTEGKGVGFSNGYTTLDLFFISSRRSLYPFIDLRGHGFDNRKVALNTGLGIRWLSPQMWIFGANLYYDYRQGDHKNFDQVGYGFQQIGLGFEALGPLLDIRMNFYYPVGKKKWNFDQVIFNDAGITPIIIPKKQSTMKGFNVETGATFFKGFFCHDEIDWSIYGAAGFYYFDQETGGGRWGGELRLKGQLTRYLFIEIEGCYDRSMNFAAQWRIGINIPLYPWTSNKIGQRYKQKDSCPFLLPWQLNEQLTQPVNRMEIIPLRS